MDAKYLEEIEALAAEVHGVYCKAYQERFGKAYWTDGDYSKLEEATKDYDRAFVRWHLERVHSLTQSLEEQRKAREKDAEAIEQTRVRAEAAEQALAEVKKAHALCGIRSMLEDAKIVMAEAKVWEPEYLKLKATLEYVGSELFKVAQGQKLDLMDLGVAINRALEPKENHGK